MSWARTAPCALLIGLVTAATAAPLLASGNTPAVMVPEERWLGSSMFPTTILSDSTDYEANFEPGCTRPVYFFASVDVEEGLLFGASANHIHIYDTTANPANPPKLLEKCRPVANGVDFRKSDLNDYYLSLDAPEGDSSFLAAGIEGGNGIVILDTSEPSTARVVYQDAGFNGVDVGTVTVAGKHYALVAAAGGVRVYNMSAARRLREALRRAC